MSQAIKEQPKAGNETKKENWLVTTWKQYGGMIMSGIGMTLLLALVGTIVGFFIGLPCRNYSYHPTPNYSRQALDFERS